MCTDSCTTLDGMQYKYEMNASASVPIPSILSCNRNPCESEATEFIKDFSDSAEMVDLM